MVEFDCTVDAPENDVANAAGSDLFVVVNVFRWTVPHSLRLQRDVKYEP